MRLKHSGLGILLDPRFMPCLIIALAVSAILGVWSWRPTRSAVDLAVHTATRQVPLRSASISAADAQVIVARNPFRTSRRPSAAPQDSSATQTVTSAPPLSRPALVLRAVVGTAGGGAWEAILEGVPGYTLGVVVREGDTLRVPAGSPATPAASGAAGNAGRNSQLILRRVRPDVVIVASPDTVWRLRLPSTDGMPPTLP